MTDEILQYGSVEDKINIFEKIGEGDGNRAASSVRCRSRSQTSEGCGALQKPLQLRQNPNLPRSLSCGFASLQGQLYESGWKVVVLRRTARGIRGKSTWVEQVLLQLFVGGVPGIIEVTLINAYIPHIVSVVHSKVSLGRSPKRSSTRVSCQYEVGSLTGLLPQR